MVCIGELVREPLQIKTDSDTDILHRGIVCVEKLYLAIKVIDVRRVGVMYLICINQGQGSVYRRRPQLVQIKYIIFLHMLQQICIHSEQA